MIRITGMNSGLDTERIIHELVRGQRTKVDTIKQNQVSTRWKMDAWQDLNNRALKLFNGTLGRMRFSTAYAQKTSRVSNNKATVVTGGTAVNGVQNLQINKLAKTGMLTGAQIKRLDGGAVAANTRLDEIMNVPAGEPMSFTVKANGQERQISLSGDTRMQDVVQQFRSAGLNANFDAGNGRFFISSQTMGAAGDFEITADNMNGFSALSALGINVFETSQYAGLAGVVKGSTEYNALRDAEILRLRNADLAALTAATNAHKNVDDRLKERLDVYRQFLVDAGHPNAATMTDKAVVEEIGLRTQAFKDALAIKQSALDALDKDDPNYDTDKANQESVINQFLSDNSALTDLNYDQYNVAAFDTDVANRTTLQTAIDDLTIKTNGSPTSEAAYNSAAEAKIDADIAFAAHALTLTGNQIGQNGAARINGEDAEILLNGAKFTSNTNVFTINGLTITANQVTDVNETITITTEDDTQGIYNMIKDFIKEYNALINEMDRLFNAPSARDYRPLTDEQKDAMSEREILEWENRIKDSLLRRDSSLFNISNAMKNGMMGGVQVGDRTLHLSHFGIGALDFFLAPINQKNALFIDGDEDSAHTSGKANRLKEMIASDPTTVTDFFIGLSRNLHGAMDRILLDRNSDFKSVNTIYNDKQLKREYDNFNAAIARQEARLTSMEDKYFRQFSRMEVALAKMQSSQNAVSGLLGMTMMNNRR